MVETAAHLVEHVLPEQPIRQWVLSFPYPLRFLFAIRPAVLSQLLGIVYWARCSTIGNVATRPSATRHQPASSGWHGQLDQPVHQTWARPPSDVIQWTVGRSLDHLPVETVARLFDALFEHSAGAFDMGVNLLGMYTHGDPDKLENLLPQVRRATECVMRWDQSRPRQLAVHRFGRLVRRILENGREDPDARAIALILARALVSNEGEDQERFVEPVLDLLLSMFPEITWPLIGQVIVSDPLQAWRLESVLGGTIGSDREEVAALLELPEDTLFAWCHAHPDRAPAFVAGVVPALTTYSYETSDRSLHPVLIRLLDEFGDRDDVLDAMVRRMYTFGWSGSLTRYFALYEKPLRTLLEHPKAQVRRWARRTLRGLSESIEAARNQDEELEAQWDV